MITVSRALKQIRAASHLSPGTLQLKLGVGALVGIRGPFSRASPEKIRSRQFYVHRQDTLLKIYAEVSKEEFLRRIGRQNLTFLLSPANPAKRSVAVFVMKISVGGNAMVVGRE